MGKKQRFFQIDCHLYPFPVNVWFGERTEEIEKFLKDSGINESGIEGYFNLEFYSFGGRAVVMDNGSIVLWMSKEPKTIDGRAKMAHEIFHCVCFLMHEVGIRYDERDSNEAFAYMVEYLHKEIYKRLKSSA